MTTPSAAELIVTQAASVAALPDSLWPAAPAPPYLTRARLRDLERDRRFATRYCVVWSGQQALLALPAYSPQSSRWPDPAYDVPARLGLATARPADSFSLVGGRADFRCAALAAPGLPALLHAAAATAALRQLRAALAHEHRDAALLYADAPASPLYNAALALGTSQGRVLGHRYSILDVGPDLAGYLRSLTARRRSVVRRDLRNLVRSGIEARHVSWGAVLAEAAPLIAEIHTAHQAPDLPALARTRLSRRAQDPDAEPVAFAVWSAGQLSSVTLGWVHARTLELYEVGLAAEPAPDRGLRYLEVMFYAPLRFMWHRGLRTLDLALAAGHPKTLRGAVPSPVMGLLLAPVPAAAPS